MKLALLGLGLAALGATAFWTLSFAAPGPTAGGSVEDKPKPRPSPSRFSRSRRRKA